MNEQHGDHGTRPVDGPLIDEAQQDALVSRASHRLVLAARRRRARKWQFALALVAAMLLALLLIAWRYHDLVPALPPVG